jgi:threonine dehydrogenase-like Zn-dependent dehydrogenase
MRALVFRGAWDIGVENRPDPRPGPDEVLIRVTATGICGSDIHGFTGENGRRHPGQIMGHETVGRILSGPEGFAPGTLVTVNPVIACGACPACRAGAEQSCPHRRVVGVTKEIPSAFADLLVVPTRNVVPLPETMPEDYGALVEPLAVGYHAARRGGATADDAVLVIGGGPIGQACLLAARRLGVRRVVVSEPNPLRRELIAALGAPAVDPTAGDLPGRIHETLGGPATLVLDAVGSSRSLADAAACSSFGARVVLVGMNAPRIELSAYTISTEERTLVGSFCYSARHFRETAEWVGGAPDELRHLIDAHVDLDAAADAFTALGKGESQASKVLVHFDSVPQEVAR